MRLYDVLAKRANAKLPYILTADSTYSQEVIETYIHHIETRFILQHKGAITLKIADQFLLVCVIWACIKNDKSFILLPEKIGEVQENSLMKQALSTCILTNKNPVSLKEKPAIDNLVLKERNTQKTVVKKEPSIAFISSGTTGTPKLIWVSYKQCTIALQAINEHTFMPYTTNAIVLISPLLTHSYGFSCLLEYTMNNATLVLPRQGSMLGLFRLITKKELQRVITTIEGVPYFYKQLQVLKDKIKFRALLHLGFGGDFVEDTLIKFFKKHYPIITFSIRYGISEIPSVISLITFSKPECQDMYGMVLPIYEIEIETKENKKEGEVIVHAKKDFSTAIDTGDIGLLKTGKLKIVGRKTSFVKVKGYKISYIHIEDAIRSAKFVSDVKVTVKDDRITSYIIPKEGYDKGDIEVYLQAKLPPYAMPDAIIKVTEIERTITGKIIRK